MNNSFFNKNAWYGKKITIFIPHQDDEINLCGGIIPTLVKNNCQIFVIYSTNGDFYVKEKVRENEAYKALKILGVPEENVFFLGYCDQFFDGPDHIYTSTKIWKNKRCHSETYTYSKKDYRYKKNGYHSIFKRENFIKDIKDIILDIMPDVIFSVDVDSHPDHRALSLSLEYAMGQILKSTKNYEPILLKGFAYPTAYNGKCDLFKKFNISTKFNTENFSLAKMQNEYYNFDERIRFPVLEKVYTNNLLKNIVFKAIKKHKSQALISKTESIINNDMIYWNRRTDNLIYGANVFVSSGNKKFLYDFMLFDYSQILYGNSKRPITSNNYWRWDKNDEKKEINIVFDAKKWIKEIVFYQQTYNKNARITLIEIIIENNVFTIELKKDSFVHKYIFEQNLNVDNLTIKIVSYIGDNPGLSEIEIFAPKKDEYQFIKLIQNDNFIYKIYDGELKNYYFYVKKTFNSYYVNKSEVFVKSVNNVEYHNGVYNLINPYRKGYLTFSLKGFPEIYDTVIILPSKIIFKSLNNIGILINKLYLYFSIFMIKSYRKIMKIMGFMYQKN